MQIRTATKIDIFLTILPISNRSLSAKNYSMIRYSESSKGWWQITGTEPGSSIKTVSMMLTIMQSEQYNA